MNWKFAFGILLLSSLAIQCVQRPKPPQPSYAKQESELLASYNREIIQAEYAEIENYIKKTGLTFSKDPLGFYYHIILPGTDSVKKGDNIDLIIETRLTDSTLCYSYSMENPLRFRVGNNEFQGLNNAVEMTRTGGELICIFPHHLAFGLFGDGKTIPPASPIVCHLTVIKTVNR